jgi:nanoRNase/pAp phosphatase (c-di-AMP/oligoRNAs hydrolase)
MPYTTEQLESHIAKAFTQFPSVFKENIEVLVVVHNFPDPDALASALAFQYLAQELFKVKVSIGYGGSVGRAENKALLKNTKIHLKHLSRIKYAKYDRIVIVDTQPGAGNNMAARRRKYHLVIDHHPLRGGVDADIILVEPGLGATASILVECLKLSTLPIPASVATALTYAISSETQNMRREAHDFDIQAYLYIYKYASIRKLSNIINPRLPQSYFVTMGATLRNAYIFRNLICTHLGDVPNAEMVAEMCDFLLRRERIGWVLCTGRFKDNLYISLRSYQSGAKAGKVISKLVHNTQNVGGHEMSAGGFIPLPNSQPEYLAELEQKLSEQFASLMGHSAAEWKRLLEE